MRWRISSAAGSLQPKKLARAPSRNRKCARRSEWRSTNDECRINIEAQSSKRDIESSFFFRISAFLCPSSLVIRHLTMAYLDQFLNIVVQHGGSDLHIGEGQPPKIRKHGDVMPIRGEPVTREEASPVL